MDRLDHDGQIVWAFLRQGGPIAHLEADAVVEAGLLRRTTGNLDRSLVRVESLHPDLRIGAGDGDGCPPEPAPDVGDASRWIALEPGVDVGNGWEVFRPQEAQHPGPVEVTLGFDHVRAVVGPADAAPGPEGLRHLWEGLDRRHQGPGEGRDGEHAVQIDQGLCVSRGKRVPAFGVCFRRVVHLQDPSDRLLLQPLTGVAFVNAGPRREGGGGGRPPFG